MYMCMCVYAYILHIHRWHSETLFDISELQVPAVGTGYWYNLYPSLTIRNPSDIRGRFRSNSIQNSCYIAESIHHCYRFWVSSVFLSDFEWVPNCFCDNSLSSSHVVGKEEGLRLVFHSKLYPSGGDVVRSSFWRHSIQPSD